MAHLQAMTSKQFESLRSRRVELSAGLASVISGQVRFDRHSRQLYSTDASIYQIEPLGVVVPSNIDDAKLAAEHCLRQGIPILPRGGGTSLAGQCTSEAVVLDLSSRCDQIRDVNVASKTCKVESGITVDSLNRSLEPSGLFFAPDPATVRQATIGGCIGNNAAGTRSIRYGRTSESVLGIDAILGNGTQVTLEAGTGSSDPVVRKITESVVEIVKRHERLIDERFPKTLRRNAGYALDMILAQIRDGTPVHKINLAPVICGSEGTLAITLGATLKLHQVPSNRALVVLAFNSLEAAMECVPGLLGLKPSAVELLDDMIIETALSNIEHRSSVTLLPQPSSGELNAILYVEFEGDTDDEFQQKHLEIKSLVPEAASKLYSSSESVQQALRLRQAGEPLLHSIPGNRKPLGFVEDNVVPVEHLTEFVRGFKQIVADHDTKAAFYAHASVGVLHVRPLLDLRSNADRKAMLDIAIRAADLARSLGGVMSGEHGDGRARGPLLERHFGPEIMNAFREVKSLFDPENLLNPGNIVAPAQISSIAESTRIRPRGHDVSIPDIDTYYSYEDQDGFAHAVERCNGAGVCRKTDSGTMCPSYMALKDERHSTRGRANALRVALSGQATGNQLAWSDTETINTLDLCLSCKGCKRECPSNVDLSRLKSEFNAQRFAIHSPVMARWAFTHFRRLSRLGSKYSKLSNWLTAPGFLRSLANRLGPIPTYRSLPKYEPVLASLPNWNEGHNSSLQTVVLFGDCSSMYSETSLGLDAKALLEAFGYRVVLADLGCCQRPAISNGFLPQAIDAIDKMVESLNSFVSEHEARALLVLEPSCLSAIQDDWIDLKCKTLRSDRVRLAGRTSMVEQFLEEHWDKHTRRPDFKQPASRVLLHAHCHQKALLGGDSSGALLRRVFGKKYAELDTGCCGMAGSFGMHKKRFDLSMQIGELSLFPTVRAKQDSDVVLATGTSCRHQMRDGVQYESEHPVTYLRNMLIWRQESDYSGIAPLFPRG
jgi:FAD/FMN-containing dehydrogenase/Fe-S oxidoreductase